MPTERRDLLNLLADGDRMARLDGNQWKFVGTDKQFPKDLVSDLIPTHINYAGAMTAPHDYSIVFWITEEGQAALRAA